MTKPVRKITYKKNGYKYIKHGIIVGFNLFKNPKRNYYEFMEIVEKEKKIFNIKFDQIIKNEKIMKVTLRDLWMLCKANRFDELESKFKSKILSRPITEFIEGDIICELTIEKL